MQDIIEKGAEKNVSAGRLTTELTPLFDQESYCEKVEQVKHYIHEGDIFQLVLSNRLEAGFDGSLLDTYRILRTKNPSPYMFYFFSDDLEIAGASPETLVKVDNQTAYTFPLAGTRPRGKDEKEDQELEADLLSDEKELASFAEIKRRWTPCSQCFRREPFRVHQSFAPVRSSTTWKTTSAAFTAVPLAIWILREIWICVSRSGWHFAKMEKYSSGREPELWRTV